MIYWQEHSRDRSIARKQLTIRRGDNNNGDKVLTRHFAIQQLEEATKWAQQTLPRSKSTKPSISLL
jgi:hypothetical protein